MNHQMGIQNLVMDVQSCVCNGGPCTNQCASEYCVNGSYTQGDNCSNCIQSALGQNGQCLAPVSQECQSDPNCNGYLTCANGCPP